MQRRIAAAARRHGITAEELAGRLYVDGIPPSSLIIAGRGYEGVQVDAEAVRHITQKILYYNIGLMVTDPFIGSHAIDENDNGSMNAVVGVWRGIAHRTGAAVLLVHHDRKGQGGNGNGEAADVGAGCVGLARRRAHRAPHSRHVGR